MMALSAEKRCLCATLPKPWNGLLGKGFISIKADKTSNDSVKNSPGINTAKRRVYLSLPTLGDNQDKDDSTF